MTPPPPGPSPAFMQALGEALAQQPVKAGTCGHPYAPRFCRDCHLKVCTFRHDGPRGFGCDEWHGHDACTGYTRGYETYRCDCICCCPYWPAPKKPAPTPSNCR